MPDRTVSEAELRENARLAADELIAKIRNIQIQNTDPATIEAAASLLTSLDQCAQEPG